MLDWIKGDGISEDLRFRGAVFSVSKKRVVFTFSFPEKPDEKLKSLVQSKLSEKECYGLSFEAEFVLDRQTHETLRTAMAEFLKENYYSVYTRFANGGYYINKDKDSDGYRLIFKLNEETLGLFNESGIIDGLNGFFENYTVTPVNVSGVVSESSEDFEEAVRKIEARQQKAEAEAVFRAARIIPVKNVKGVIGRVIKKQPIYISELKSEDERVCVCGEITSIKSEPPKNPEADYALRANLRIKDFSGEIGVTMFLRGDETEKLGQLSAGSQVIVSGKTKVFSGSRGRELSVTAYALSTCEIGEVKEIPVRPVPEKYVTVMPEPFASMKQTGMFDAPQIIPEFLLDKNVVVFDLETTGLSPLRDRIVEIGAVRIKNGVITESFETLVNPLMPMPEEASKVNNITDEMLIGQPKITQVLGDFRKFCDGAVIAAHNIQFDYAFIKESADKMGYKFDNVKWDTLEIARNFYSGRHQGVEFPRDYKLQTLAKVLGVKAEDAHRAMDDARVCAEVLIKIVSMSGESPIEEIVI